MLTFLLSIVVSLSALALFLFLDDIIAFIRNLIHKEGQIKLVFKDRSKGGQFFNYMNVTLIYVWRKAYADWYETGRYYNTTMNSFGTVRSGYFVGTIDEFEMRINRRQRHEIELNYYLGKLAEFRAQRETTVQQASEDQPAQA